MMGWWHSLSISDTWTEMQIWHRDWLCILHPCNTKTCFGVHNHLVYNKCSCWTAVCISSWLVVWFIFHLSFPADNAFSSCTLWATSRIKRRSLHQASALRWDLRCNICDGLFSGLSAMLEPRCEKRIIYFYKDIQKEISLIQFVIMVHRWQLQVPPTTQNVINGVWEESSTDRWLTENSVLSIGKRDIWSHGCKYLALF